MDSQKVNLQVCSLFAGIGGIDLAFKQAGAEIVWANDIDPYVCKIYRHNFGNEFIVEDDIRNVDAETISDFDVLTAGFPCQSFSTMGKQRGFADPRGNLFFEIARIVQAKQPSIIFLENVKNLVAHYNGRTFITIHNTFAELGYAVKYKVMNATEFGNLPQERARIFLVAMRDLDMLERFEFPDEIPLTTDINDIIDRADRKHEIYYYQPGNKYYGKLNERITDKQNIYRIDDSGVATRSWNPCPTLKANMGTYPDRVPIVRDDFGIRKLTPYECLAFQGFPKDYRLPNVPLDPIYKAIGNTVPVPVVQRIAEKLMQLRGANNGKFNRQSL